MMKSNAPPAPSRSRQGFRSPQRGPLRLDVTVLMMPSRDASRPALAPALDRSRAIPTPRRTPPRYICFARASSNLVAGAHVQHRRHSLLGHLTETSVTHSATSPISVPSGRSAPRPADRIEHRQRLVRLIRRPRLDRVPRLPPFDQAHSETLCLLPRLARDNRQHRIPASPSPFSLSLPIRMNVHRYSLTQSEFLVDMLRLQIEGRARRPSSISWQLPVWSSPDSSTARSRRSP